jgi:SAM-dependent methyltransferase
MALEEKPRSAADISLLSNLLFNRYLLSYLYLRGSGIEIGALHNPLRVLPWTRVKYVDRLSVADLRRQYTELENRKLVPVDIVDDGERLAMLDDCSQDFVIANHFLEHCQNPLLALENAMRVLRPAGTLYLALPDMRYTFDCNRRITPLEHLLRDYREGPSWSYRGHFEEWVRLVNGVSDKLAIAKDVEQLMAMEYSIHFHCWTQREMLEMILFLRSNLPLEVEVMLKHKGEVIFIIRKGATA